MNIKTIKRFTGSIMFRRGMDYYLKGRIHELTQETNVLRAKVRGSAANVYDVNINLYYDNIAQARCSCPYPLICKHIAGVLIYHSLLGPDKENKIVNPLNQNLKKSSGRKIINLDFKEDDNKQYQSFLHKYILADFKEKGAKRWRLIFKIEQVGKYYEKNQSGYVISPALQYLKLDGSPGRVVAYKQQHIMEPVTNNQRRLLLNLLENEDNNGDLFNYITWIINDRQLPVYLVNGRRLKSISYRTIEKTEIHFTLSRISGGKCHFKPYLVFTDSKEQKMSAAGIEHTPLVSHNLYVNILSEGTIMYKEDDGIYGSFIKGLLQSDLELVPKEIQALKSFVKNRLKNQVKVVFPAHSVCIIEYKPQPVIELWQDPQREKALIKIVFKYNDSEVGFTSKNDYIIITHNPVIEAYRRNRVLEKKIMDFFEYKTGDSLEGYTYYFINRKYDFKSKNTVEQFLLDYGLILMDEGFAVRLKGEKKQLKPNRGKIAITAGSGIDWFDLKLEYRDERGIKNNFDLNMEYISKGILPLKKSFVLLSRSDILKIEKLYNQGMDKKGRLRISRYNFSLIDELYEEISNKEEQEEFTNAFSISQKLKGFRELGDYPRAGKFKGTLRDYQKAGYNWLCFLREYNLNGCLADDMGLGKTVQTLALLCKLKEKKQLRASLLVVPVTTIVNWECEIRRFSPNLSFHRHSGHKRRKKIKPLLDKDLIIVSYQTLRNDIEMFRDNEFDYIILDESHIIKNPHSKVFKGLKILKAQHRLCLTGTPIENNTIELWAQMDFLNHGLLGSINYFKQEFARAIEKEQDEVATQKLRKMVYPFILRRKKEDVLKDLPDKEEILFYTEMSEKQREVYKQLAGYYRARIEGLIDEKGLNNTAIYILDALLRLRQFSLFPQLVSTDYKGIESCKFQCLKQMIQEILEEDHKILLFSQFVGSLKIIEKYIKHQNVKYSYIDGSTRDRADQVKQFQEKLEVKLFLLSLKAGGVGINLTAADYVIIFDPWWNPAVENQAVDRSHRIGQKKKVIVYKLIVKDSVEEKVLLLQQKKKELADQLISRDSGLLKSLTKNDVIDIFK